MELRDTVYIDRINVDSTVSRYDPTEALRGHRVLWKIEIYYLIQMS